MTAWAKGLPTSDVTPVRSKRPPTFTWAAAGAPERARTARPTETRAQTRFMRTPSCFSVRERPHAEVVLDGVPAGGEPVRLEDQEHDDEQAEHPLADRGEGADELGRQPGERGEGQAQQLGQEGHEHGAEDRPQYRAEPTDDDHGQVVDGHPDREVLGGDNPG